MASYKVFYGSLVMETSSPWVRTVTVGKSHRLLEDVKDQDKPLGLRFIPSSLLCQSSSKGWLWPFWNKQYNLINWFFDRQLWECQVKHLPEKSTWSTMLQPSDPQDWIIRSQKVVGLFFVFTTVKPTERKPQKSDYCIRLSSTRFSLGCPSP